MNRKTLIIGIAGLALALVILAQIGEAIQGWGTTETPTTSSTGAREEIPLSVIPQLPGWAQELVVPGGVVPPNVLDWLKSQGGVAAGQKPLYSPLPGITAMWPANARPAVVGSPTATVRPTKVPTPIVYKPSDAGVVKLDPAVPPGPQTGESVSVRVRRPGAEDQVKGGYRQVINDCQAPGEPPEGRACWKGAEIQAVVPVTTTMITVKPGLTVKNCVASWKSAGVSADGEPERGFQLKFMVIMMGDMTMDLCTSERGELTEPFWVMGSNGSDLVIQKIAAKKEISSFGNSIYFLLKEQIYLPGAAALMPTPAPTATPTPTATTTPTRGAIGAKSPTSTRTATPTR